MVAGSPPVIVVRKYTEGEEVWLVSDGDETGPVGQGSVGSSGRGGRIIEKFPVGAAVDDVGLP